MEGLSHLRRPRGVKTSGFLVDVGIFGACFTHFWPSERRWAQDFDRIRREQKRPPTSDERQRCAVSIIGILVNTALGIGAMSSSVSTCAGSVNVPANCAANINAFVGNALVLVGTAMAADLSCPAAPIQVGSRSRFHRFKRERQEQIEDKKEEIEPLGPAI